MNAMQPESVLVHVGLDRVGDGLLKLPFVRGLRRAFPSARITWLAGKETSVYANVLAPKCYLSWKSCRYGWLIFR